MTCLSLSNSWVTHSIPLITLSSPFLVHLCAITFRMSYIRCYSVAHFKSTGVCILIFSLNLLNTMIYLRIVIYEDLFECIHIYLLELMHIDLFPKIYRNLCRSAERERHNKRCYLVRGWWQTPSCLPGWKTPNLCKLQD
jgi:hypothetical protein